MDYFSSFQWWYLGIPVIALVLVLALKGSRSRISKQYEVELLVMDPRFNSCTPEVRLAFFEKSREQHLEIDIQDLDVPVGDSLDILVNNDPLASIRIAFHDEVEYDQWGNADNPLPDIRPGDELVIAYQGRPVMKGKFTQTI